MTNKTKGIALVAVMVLTASLITAATVNLNDALATAGSAAGGGGGGSGGDGGKKGGSGDGGNNLITSPLPPGFILSK